MAYGIFPCIWVKRIMWKISWKIMMALKELLDGLFKIFPLTRFLTSYIYPSPPLSYLILSLPSLKKPPVSPPSTTRKILHRNCKHLSSTPPTPNAPTDVSCTFAPRPARIVKEMDGVIVYTLLFPPTPTAVENCRTRSCPDGKRQEQKSLVWVLVEEVGYINPISSSQTHQSKRVKIQAGRRPNASIQADEANSLASSIIINGKITGSLKLPRRGPGLDAVVYTS